MANEPMIPDAPRPSATSSATATTSPALIAVAWLVVGLPAAWGVASTARQAANLFRGPPPVPAATQAAPASVPGGR